MKSYKILLFPDPFLRNRATAEFFESDLKLIADRMFYTMYEYQGIGLAATQVGLDLRMFVMDVPTQEGEEERSEPLTLINPQIVSRSGEITFEEGCLSFPGQKAEVTRSETVEATFKDVNGEERIHSFCGLAAVCVQHEIDHLNGILFIDHISPLRRNMIKKKMKRLNDDKQ